MLKDTFLLKDTLLCFAKGCFYVCMYVNAFVPCVHVYVSVLKLLFLVITR